MQSVQSIHDAWLVEQLQSHSIARTLIVLRADLHLLHDPSVSQLLFPLHSHHLYEQAEHGDQDGAHDADEDD